MSDTFRMHDRKGEQKVSVTFTMEVLDDENPDLSWLTQDYSDVEDPVERQRYLDEDRQRLADYNSGNWHMTGIRARADILVPIGQGSFASYTLTSPGIWGVESDCGDEYRKELFESECEALRHAVRAIGEAV